jgi:hypothetical protein
MLSDYSIQGAAIVNKSCLGNEMLEIPYQRPKFLKFSGGGALDCVRGWRLAHADHTDHAQKTVAPLCVWHCIIMEK